MEWRLDDIGKGVLPDPDRAICRKLGCNAGGTRGAAQPLSDAPAALLARILSAADVRLQVAHPANTGPTVAVGRVEDVVQLLAPEFPLAMLFFGCVLIDSTYPGREDPSALPPP